MTAEFKHALEIALRELNLRTDERNKLDKKILELRQLVNNLLTVLGMDKIKEDDAGPTITTDEVRKIFQANRGTIINAPDVAGILKSLGYDLEKYQNPLATIGVILRRLATAGEITQAGAIGGKRGYVARTPTLADLHKVFTTRQPRIFRVPGTAKDSGMRGETSAGDKKKGE